MSLTLGDIPLEILLDNLLPTLPLHDLLALSSVNRFWAAVGSEDLFWKRKLKEDYNFDGSASARTTGWKFMYKQMRDPQLFVWGDTDNSRLGTTTYKPVKGLAGCPTPVRLSIPNARIVGLVAGGWSFHALDSMGRVYVWGQLEPGFALPSDGFSKAHKVAKTPLRLDLPKDLRIQSLKCGRSFGVGLDHKARVWSFASWGRPYRFNSPCLTDPIAPIIQVECGWSFGAALSSIGDVYIWWPGEGDMQQHIQARMRHFDALDDDKYRGMQSDGQIKCFDWIFDEMDPILLPPIPTTLPPLKTDSPSRNECKLNKIAAGDNFVIGLTNGGHVLAFSIPEDRQLLQRCRWQYIPNFCHLESIASLGLFEAAGVTRPTSIDITHISAHFHTFVAYSTGGSASVLLGSSDNIDPQLKPLIIPSLQGQRIVSIHLGDYHFGALTESGKLLTWGKYSRGALGLGDPTLIPRGAPGGFNNDVWPENSRRLPVPPDVTIPSEVSFGGPEKETFCFAASAAGWHFGALVIDLL